MNKKKFRIFVFCFVCIIGFSFCLPRADAVEWQISKSKTATPLDTQYTSALTLSLPAAQQEIASDVVFVLDKSTSTAIEQEVLSLLQRLRTQLQGSNAKINVGVVIFNKTAHAQCALTDLATGYDEIKKAIETTITSGTNIHAGLLCAKSMLDADTAVPADRKYMILISDGITYMYNTSPTSIYSKNGDNTVSIASPDCWSIKYGNDQPPQDWDAWLVSLQQLIAQDAASFDVPYGSLDKEKVIAYQDRLDHAMCIDKALYLTCQVYSQAQQAGYHCFALRADTTSGSAYTWGPSFMDYLAKGEEVSFANIQKEILYLIDAGSHVIDVIGQGESHLQDGMPFAQAYDFAFVNDPAALSLRVGEKTLSVTVLKENVYAFGTPTASSAGAQTYPFVLTYYPNGTQGDAREQIVWQINTAVEITHPVTLQYHVRLTNPQTQPAAYSALYTNAEAVLLPVKTNGQTLPGELFDRPEVSYTVASSQPIPTDPSETTVPHTGDSKMIVVWAGLLVCSFGAGLGLWWHKRKKQH